jgi:hypothetical protein
VLVSRRILGVLPEPGLRQRDTVANGLAWAHHWTMTSYWPGGPAPQRISARCLSHSNTKGKLLVAELRLKPKPRLIKVWRNRPFSPPPIKTNNHTFRTLSVEYHIIQMPELAVALVDYDNVKTKQDRSAGDVGVNLADLLPALINETANLPERPKELLVRVYGGWIDERGRQSQRAQWLLAGLAWYRGRRGPTIIKPSLVTALACRTSDTLVGTIRQTPTGFRQKMVDILIAIDAIYFARDCGHAVVIFSDDDDLVPAALAASSMVRPLHFHWLRRRTAGSAMNDVLLQRAGVTIRVP